MDVDFATTFHDDVLLSKQQVCFQYGITSHYHLARARVLFAAPFDVLKGASYFYSALEFRYCIERLLFELVVLNHKKTTTISKNLEKVYNGVDLKKVILREAPDFPERMRFINLMLQAAKPDQFVGALDLDSLCKLYGKLGAYLHCLKRPEKTVQDRGWWQAFHNLLLECSLVLGRILGTPNVLAGFHAKDGEDDGPFEKWKRNELTDDDIVFKMMQELKASTGKQDDSVS